MTSSFLGLISRRDTVNFATRKRSLQVDYMTDQESPVANKINQIKPTFEDDRMELFIRNNEGGKEFVYFVYRPFLSGGVLSDKITVAKAEIPEDLSLLDVEEELKRRTVDRLHN